MDSHGIENKPQIRIKPDPRLIPGNTVHRPGRNRRDIVALICLGILLLMLFTPALAGWRGIFHDDMAMDFFPWHFFMARHFQSGVVPLWDSETWCGAKPFYARYYADTYYLPLWPFFLLSPLDDLDQAYLVNCLIPLFFHYCLAGVGMYLLARRGIRLRPLPAFVTAGVYLFSPIFAYSYVGFQIAAVPGWLPWLALIVVSMDRGAGFGRVAAGGCVIALMITSAAPHSTASSLLLCGLLAVGLGLRRLRGRRKRLFFRSPLQLASAVLFGLALSAVYWISSLDGAAYTEQHLPMTYEAMTGEDGSMPPVYLATLVIPDLFGTVSGFNNRNWVEAVTHGVRFWDANLSGGLLLTFLALVGTFLIVKRPLTRRLRFWAGFAILLWILSILLVLGRHTPFYYFFYKWVPVYSRFPFPIRYRLLQVVATAWLAGLGIEYLCSVKRDSSIREKRLVWWYIVLSGLAGVLALFGSAGIRGWFSGSFSLPGLDEIARRSNLEWFITGPGFYFFAAGLLLVLVWRGLRGKRRAISMAALVILETVVFTFAAFYFCIFRFHEPQPQQLRSLGPSTHPMVQRVLRTLDTQRTDRTLRWATDQPFHDNFARLDSSGSYAFMGYDMKPLERRFKQAFEEAYGRPVGWPLYWDFPRPVYSSFLSNMSVGYLLDSRPDNPFPGEKTEKLESTPDFFLHSNPGALPRAFTLDRLVECSEDEAMQKLVKGDLRGAVFIDDVNQLALSGKQASRESKRLAVSSKQSASTGEQLPLTAHSLPLTAYRSFDPGSKKEYVGHFNELQIANPVKRLDFSNPNRVNVDLNITRPAMLVLTETWYPGWEARVDGEPVELYRVNYLQRGVWLNRGNHNVEMVFRPGSWLIGAVISLVSWGIVVIVSAGWVLNRVLAHQVIDRNKKE